MAPAWRADPLKIESAADAEDGRRPLIVPEALLKRPGVREAAEKLAREYGFSGVEVARKMELVTVSTPRPSLARFYREGRLR